VVELGSFPSSRTEMANLALRREPCGDMIGLLGSLKVFGMALRTLRGRAPEAAIAMALPAIERSMRALQPETGDGFVVPRPGDERAPSLRGMAVAALSAQSELVGIIVPASPVAGLAGLRGSFQDPLQMAIATLHGSVLPHQGEIRIVVGLHQILRTLLAGGGAGNGGSRRKRQPTQEKSQCGSNQACLLVSHFLAGTSSGDGGTRPTR